MSNNLSDEDFGINATRDDSIGEQVAYVAPVRGGSAIKSIFAPANRKRLIAYGVSGVLLFGGLTYSFLSTDAEEAAAASVAGRVQGSRLATRESAGSSELQRQAAEAYNQETLPEIQQENPTAHPIIPLEAAENPFETAREIRTPPRVSEAGSTERVQQTSKVAPPPPAQQDNKDLDAFIRGIVEEEASEPRKLAVSWKYPKPAQQANNAAAASAGQNTNGITSQSQNRCEALTRAGDMYMATTDIALNSDVGGPAALTIRNGKLRNFRLIGTFERKEEWVRLEFTRLVGPAKTFDGIKAVGLDLVTTLNAVNGEVDRHLLYRYGWWGLGTALKAVGKAAESNADQQVVITNGTAVQSTQKDSAREIKMAIGSLGDDLGSTFQDRIDRPITVSLKVGDEVGVFFIDDVCK